MSMNKGSRLKPKIISKRLLLGITLFDLTNKDNGQSTHPYKVRMVSFRELSYNTLNLMLELTHTTIN